MISVQIQIVWCVELEYHYAAFANLDILMIILTVFHVQSIIVQIATMMFWFVRVALMVTAMILVVVTPVLQIAHIVSFHQLAFNVMKILALIQIIYVESAQLNALFVISTM